MKRLDFSRLSQSKREQLSGFIDSWKKSPANLSVLEESLMLLSSSPRPRAYELSQEGSRAALLACTYGKGPVPKLALQKKDAGRLLALVQGVKSAYESARLPPKGTLAGTLSAVVSGEEASQTGKVRSVLMKALSRFVDAARQCLLF